MVHIKSVSLKYFRSYKEQTVDLDFSPETNAIVGENGTGKSNFFLAVRFVCDMFHNLTENERKLLLHAGGATNIISGHVEVKFDNSREGNEERRFPIEKDEVSIRRSIGSKKDEFFLNSKHVTRQEVMNFLESAGFSRSNPYYIVQQGKVDELTNMTDEKRLDLLKEVAGTRVYDEKRAESEKIMAETSTKLREVEKVLQYIEERLLELQNEQEELALFEKFDKERRALEYAMHSKELDAADYKLRKLAEKKEQDESLQNDGIAEAASEVHNAIKEKEKHFATLSEQILNLKTEREALAGHRHELRETIAKMELQLVEKRDRFKSDKDQAVQLQITLEELAREISKTRQELENVKDEYQQSLASERETLNRLHSAQHRVRALYAKQGRTKQFSSKKERDGHIKSEMKKLETTVKEKRKLLAELQTENAALSAKIATLQERESSMQKDIAKRESLTKKLGKEWETEDERRRELSNSRTLHWRTEDELKRKITQANNEIQNAERALRSTLKKVTWDGIKAISEIVGRKSIKGVYGPLIELFECAPEYRVAIEAAAGGSLFHIVVENDEVAAKLLTELNKERSGRVTFMPLNRLHPMVAPTLDTDEVKSMSSLLQFNPRVRKAIEQVFGRTLLCRSLEIATAFAGTDGYSCVTLDGDKIDRKGAIHGGYYEREFSSLEAMSQVRTLKRSLTELHSEAEKTKAIVEEIDQECTAVLSNVHRNETKRAQIKDSISHIEMDLRNISKEKTCVQKQLEEKEALVVDTSSSIKQLEDIVKSMVEEMSSQFKDLSNTELKELQTANEEVEQLQQEEIEVTTVRAKLETRKKNLENLLFENLLMREDSVRQDLSSLENTDEHQISQITRDLEDAAEMLVKVEDSMTTIESKVESCEKDHKSLDEEIETLRNEFEGHCEQVQRASKRREIFLNKQNLITQKREDYVRKIQELGPLPANADEYLHLSTKVLEDRLQKTTAELSNYTHVNKKASEQLSTFNKQRDNLISRKSDLDKGEHKIKTLIDHLDRQKDEVIFNTFDKVCRKFSEVFRELVPAGAATLVRLCENESRSMSVVRGIAIKVSFVSNNLSGPDAVQIHSLSGGQKSLVALALIFAIQRCDRAPFYVLDEIDAALDPVHRKAVADMIARQARKPGGNSKQSQMDRQSQPSQFIFSSFGEELVEIARKHYGIQFEHNVSTIDPIDKNSAVEKVRSRRDTEPARRNA